MGRACWRNTRGWFARPTTARSPTFTLALNQATKGLPWRACVPVVFSADGVHLKGSNRCALLLSTRLAVHWPLQHFLILPQRTMVLSLQCEPTAFAAAIGTDGRATIP